MFPGNEIPQLKKLTKITIQEPHRFSYTTGLLIDILSMAPNLTSMYIKSTFTLTTFCGAMTYLETKLHRSLTSLGLSGSHRLGSTFTGLRLTTLEINNLNGHGKYEFVKKLLQSHHSTLVTVILGKRVMNENPTSGLPQPDLMSMIENLETAQFIFPPVMENLNFSKVNLSQFKFLRVH